VEDRRGKIILAPYVYLKKDVLGPGLRIFLAEIKNEKVFSSKVLEFLPAVFECLETTAGIN